MRDEWLNPTNDVGWTRSPLRDAEVDDSIYEKHENDEEKYLERNMLVGNIFLVNTIEPDTDEYECSPEHNEFSEKLDYLRRLRSNEMASSNQEIGVVGEESIEHDADCIDLGRKNNENEMKVLTN